MTTTGTEAKLLVVDDEPNIRDLLASSLRFAGFDVVTAEDGSGAFHEAQTSRPDLIVLDVMLPDMDGFTVTRRLRDAGITTPVAGTVRRLAVGARQQVEGGDLLVVVE